MPLREKDNSKALVATRRENADFALSMIKSLKTTGKTLAISRFLLNEVRSSLVSRKAEDPIIDPDRNSAATEQRDGAEPVMELVRISVKPDTKRANEWDESINWEASSDKWQKSGKMPPYASLLVPYDIWRKHYAKNKLGQYRGTEAPAENCILLPEDEEKWKSITAQKEASLVAVSEDADENVEEAVLLVNSTKEADPSVNCLDVAAPSGDATEYKASDSISLQQTLQVVAASSEQGKIDVVGDDEHTASESMWVEKVSLSSSLAPVSASAPAPR